VRTGAFFDVDDTLIAVKSVFRFLAHRLRDRPESEYAAAYGRVRAAGGGGRGAALAEYYRLFAGAEEAEVAESGRRWFSEELAAGPFHEPVLERFLGHRAAGELTVLVSGSFPACLDPIAEHVGADLLVCSRPEVRAGRYTGAVATPMIGEAKAAAVREIAARFDVDLAGSSAYGDHPSDLPVLELVGFPVVVGDDPDLVGHAARRGWTVVEQAR
jgi:HAD superfamily hydrolase (TIGR01490 family)